jgi:hypothetical protein
MVKQLQDLPVSEFNLPPFVQWRTDEVVTIREFFRQDPCIGRRQTS